MQEMGERRAARPPDTPNHDAQAMSRPLHISVSDHKTPDLARASRGFSDGSAQASGVDFDLQVHDPGHARASWLHDGDSRCLAEKRCFRSR